MSLFRHRLATIGLLLLLLLILLALFAPLLAPYDPAAQSLDEGLAAPSTAHLLGQDKLGRDILSRIIYGARISLLVGVVTVSFSLSIGLLLGSLAGYAGSWVDDLLMRVIDILLAFPGLLLAVAFTAVLGPSLRNVILALTLVGWVGYARIVRGQILSVKEHEFVAAAQALGASPSRVILRHILPNILAPVIVEATFGMAGAIVTEAGLSFLGLGVQPPTASWGSMLSEGREFLLAAPHLSTWPGLALMLVVMGLNFLGDGLRDLLAVRDGVK